MHKLTFVAISLALPLAARAANPPNPACAEVRAACEKAGFVEGGKAQGNGLIVDCISPLVKGTPQRAKATKPLPQVGADALASCRGSASASASAGARKVTAQELEQLKQTHTVVPVAQVKAAPDLTAQNSAIIDTWVKAHPENAALANFDIDPATATDLGGDDYLDKSTGFVTQGPETSRAILAASIADSEDAANLSKTYAMAYAGISSFNARHAAAKIENIGSYKFSELPAPGSVTSASAAKAALMPFTDFAAMSGLHDKVLQSVMQAALADEHLHSCDGNVGFGDGGDREDGKGSSPSVKGADACSGFASDGVMANYNFMSRPYLSCVKNQSHRGTCWSFALTSAFEMIHAMSTAAEKGTPEFVDLSEQDLVANEKLLWNPDPEWFKDGDSPKTVIDSMLSTGYRQPYEKSWDYNGARSRETVGTTYTHSCDGYSEDCSDTDHQAKLLLPPADAANAVSLFFMLPSVSGGLKAPTGHASLVQSSPQATMPMLIAFAMLSMPIVISIHEYEPEIHAASSTGWVLPPQKGDTKGGGHVVHLVGYISNETIAASKAMSKHLHDSSTGGGYFIIKNSWGACSGDGGYYYFPVSYLQAYLTGAMAVD